ncbi:MAG: NupC/NupG family nucleoside CNT transporter [Cyanobacteria bacterium SZAS LIN-3]|nr:NupC/NupG family nucleoside CNT transporter [Cyanobacteria bacterium SZAS LIN-3]MBS2011187.1 NupC/NupG family nucleoside CNT transporter [Cyanobacteria bacterium SZAS TMP-1]
MTLFVSYLLSNNKKAIKWRSAFIGLGLTFVVCLLVLKVPFTREVFEFIGQGINKLLDYAVDGAAFVVGDELAHGKFVFAVRIGSSIIFVSMLSALLYYLGVLQFIVKKLAYVLMRTMGISGPEAVSTAAAIFVGQVECQVLIRPYIKNLSSSELFCSMASAMATVSGSALIAYTALGMPAPLLLAASIMSACAGLVLCKIVWPETDKRVLSGAVELSDDHKAVNVFDAMAKGAMTGWDIVVHVMVMVLAAVAFIAMLNGVLAATVHLGGHALEVQDIAGYFFTPVAWLLGVPWHDCVHVGRLMASEILINEYVSYAELAKVMHGQGSYTLAPASQMIAVVALCGFANLSSIGINIGGLGAMAPERRSEIARMGLKALITANMATHLSAAIVALIG